MLALLAMPSGLKGGSLLNHLRNSERQQTPIPKAHCISRI
jgi:hypothetical protein